jgi:hypothetical protein
MSDTPNRFIEFLVQVQKVNEGGFHGPAMAVKAGGAVACTDADIRIMSSKRDSPQGCELFGPILPNTQQVATCIASIGMSVSCETCVANSLSTVLNCLNACGYNNGEIDSNPNQQCITCMTELMDTMSDTTKMLEPCGLDTNQSAILFSNFVPRGDSATTTTVAPATTTKGVGIASRTAATLLAIFATL